MCIYVYIACIHYIHTDRYIHDMHTYTYIHASAKKVSYFLLIDTHFSGSPRYRPGQCPSSCPVLNKTCLKLDSNLWQQSYSCPVDLTAEEEKQKQTNKQTNKERNSTMEKGQFQGQI